MSIIFTVSIVLLILLFGYLVYRSLVNKDIDLVFHCEDCTDGDPENVVEEMEVEVGLFIY